jgi:tetratricopeptide (TPR) repeat protein
VRDTLSQFVEQRDNLLLVVSTSDREMAYVLKTLEGMDEGSPSDLFLIFAEPFADGPAYASAIMKNLYVQMEVAKATLKERGEGPFPPLPELCDDEAAPPVARLRAAIDHVASLVPAQGGHRAVWGFLPLQIADQEGYARLAGEFVMWSGPELWMRGLRVIARDDRERPFLFPALRKKKAPGVLLYDLDMSPEALNDALVKEAADRSAPVADRMQALMQLAGIDYAYKRYPEAIDKYRVLYNYYAEHNAPAMQAVVLQGVGDAILRLGDPRAAKVKYHQGLALAMQTQSLPILLNLTSAIGDVDLGLEDYRDAEGFFGLAAQIAGKMQNPFVKADALEKQGLARERTGDEAGAVVAWRDAAALCKTFAYHERHRSVLERLIRAYRSMCLDEERRACEAELKATRQAMKEAAQAAHEHPLRSTP